MAIAIDLSVYPHPYTATTNCVSSCSIHIEQMTTGASQRLIKSSPRIPCCIVHSMVILIHPSFLGTNNAQPHHGLLLGLMTFSSSFTCFVNAIISLDESNLTGMETCFVAWLKFNVMHHALHCIHALKLFHNHIFVLDGFTWMTHMLWWFLDCEWLMCAL